MAYLHNIMVKIHNTKDKILNQLLSNKKEEFTIRAISKNIAVDYKTVYLKIQELAESKAVQTRKAGQTILCSINPKVFDAEVFRAELARKEERLKNKNLSTMYSYFKDIKEPFFVLLLFGSYASGKNRKKSDIDLMLITDDEKIKKEIKSKISLIPLEIHLLSFTSDEFLSMLKTTEFNVGKEAFYNNTLLFGIEDYYRLIEHA